MALSSFPLLSLEEIAENCKELFGIEIPKEVLQQPTPQFVKRFYLEAFSSMFHISPEQMTQPSFNHLSELKYPDLMEEGASSIFFTSVLQRFMHACGIKDFSISDVTTPKSKRSMKCISAIINFQKFKASQDHIFENILTEKATITEQKKKLMNTNRELRRKIAEIKASRAEDEGKIQQILPEVESLRRTVDDLNQQQATENEEYNKQKTELAKLTATAAEIKVAIVNEKEECEKREAQIVTSPDKFRGEIIRLNNTIHSCKSSIGETTHKIQGLNKHQEESNVLEEVSSQAVKLISSIEEGIEKLSVLQDKVQTMHDYGTNNEEVLKELTAKFQNVKRHLASQSEKLARLDTKNDKKASSTVFNIEQTEKAVDVCRKNVQRARDEVFQMETKSKEIIKMLEDKENSHDNSMKRMKDLYQQLLEQLDIYHKSLEKGWEQLSNTLTN